MPTCLAGRDKKQTEKNFTTKKTLVCISLFYTAVANRVAKTMAFTNKQSFGKNISVVGFLLT